MFKYLRVQFIQPCRAECAWCSTHKKNPIFQSIKNDGRDTDFHQTYLEIIERFQPEELFISGGEPLLHKDIGAFLTQAAKFTQRIHLFTSYQFSRRVMDAVTEIQFPESVILNHTPIYFEPDRWHKLTNGFPFEVYIDNIRRAVDLPVRKRFKFIVNHSLFESEIERFRAYVAPNDTCEVSLKLMNDQGDGLVVDTMKASADRVQSRLGELDGLLENAGWRNISLVSVMQALMSIQS